MDRLECEILQIINETIEGKYIGKLRVTTEGNIYCLDLFLNNTTAPAISFIKECKNENDFKEFVRILLTEELLPLPTQMVDGTVFYRSRYCFSNKC